MQEFEIYIDKLFSDPGFALFMGLISLWYSFYLYRLPQKVNGLLFMTMSNSQSKSPRETTFVIINNSNRDIIKSDLLNEIPLKIVFNENVVVYDFVLTYSSFDKGKVCLLQDTKNKYELHFDILKKKQAIVLMATHNSKKIMDESLSDIEIEGILVNAEIERDDFSDQMIYKAKSVEFEAAIGAALLAILISYAARAFIKPINPNFPFTYLFVGSFFISLIPLYNYFAGRVGHNEYKQFWKVLKQSKKG